VGSATASRKGIASDASFPGPSAGATPLKELASDPLLQVDVEEKQDRITEIFDKYNLLALPVVDEAGKLAGAITADEVISLLRQK